MRLCGMRDGDNFSTAYGGRHAVHSNAAAGYFFAILAAAFLLLYYLAWIRYYKGGAYYPEIYTNNFLGIPLPMAVFSVLYYIAASIWLCNLIALCAAMVYGVCHIANAAAAKKDIKCRL